MDKSQIFEFVKKEKEKGIEDSVIRMILLAKEYHADDVEDVIRAVNQQKAIPAEKQINPFKDLNAPKKVLWGKVIILVIIQLGVIYFSESSPTKECLVGSGNVSLCYAYKFFPVLIFILPILIWIINFFFRGKKTYTVIVATFISLTIASIIYLA